MNNKLVILLLLSTMSYSQSKVAQVIGGAAKGYIEYRGYSPSLPVKYVNPTPSTLSKLNNTVWYSTDTKQMLVFPMYYDSLNYYPIKLNGRDIGVMMNAYGDMLKSSGVTFEISNQGLRNMTVKYVKNGTTIIAPFHR